jgi:glycosyltransferase involved in cell wall biosynthesis
MSVVSPQYRVTVVIPTRNEARNLPECLRRLDGFAEIVIIDSRSTDATRDIAAAAGAKVVDFAWQPGRPKKRNWALLNYAFKTNWVLFLDADECLTERFKAALGAAVERTDVAGYWLHYAVHFMGRELRHGIPQKKLALMRTGVGLFEAIADAGWTDLDMEVHEHPVLDGPIGEILEPIEHREFRGLDHFRKKHDGYATWEAHRTLALEAGAGAPRLTIRQAFKYRHIEKWWFAPFYFLAAYVWKRGFLDGWAGFRYALEKARYFSTVREKIRRLRRASPESQAVAI